MHFSTLTHSNSNLQNMRWHCFSHITVQAHIYNSFFQSPSIQAGFGTILNNYCNLQTNWERNIAVHIIFHINRNLSFMLFVNKLLRCPTFLCVRYKLLRSENSLLTIINILDIYFYRYQTEKAITTKLLHFQKIIIILTVIIYLPSCPWKQWLLQIHSLCISERLQQYSFPCLLPPTKES